MLFGSKSRLTAPPGWMFDKCGAVNVSMVRVGKVGDWLAFDSSKMKDINFVLVDEPAWGVETRMPEKIEASAVGKKLRSLPVEAGSRGGAVDSIVCRARAVNAAENKGIGAFDAAYRRCSG